MAHRLRTVGSKQWAASAFGESRRAGIEGMLTAGLLTSGR